MKIIWSETTRQDLREIFDNIIEEDPHVARALLKKIKDHASLLKSNPQIGQVGRAESTREVLPEFTIAYHIALKISRFRS